MIEAIDTSGNTVSLWFSDCQIPHFQPLSQDLHADVCIIGGGIAGLTTAYKLCLEGKKVVLLEDGNILSGETGRTTGHLCSAVDDHFFELEKTYGKEKTKLVAESHTAAIDLIESIIKAEAIECEFRRVEGYLFLAEDDDIETLAKEKEAATRAGLKVELLEKANINDFKLGPVLKFYNQAKFHPLKYLVGLAQAITKRGGKIFTMTHACDIQPGKNVEIATSTGFTITAKNVVIATNAPILDEAMLFAKQEANRTYVIGVTVKGQQDLEDALFWDTGDPYHYMRFHSVGNTQKELILSVGGEDHRVGKEVDKKKLLKQLANWAKKIVPQYNEVKYYWSGQILEPADHLAFIGLMDSHEKNIFVVTGDSGNGLTHATLAAMLLTDEVMKRENTWSTLYNPKRVPIKNMGTFLSNNLKSASEFMQYFTPGEVTNVNEIKKDEGAILRKGLHKIAVYRDKDNELHYCSAVCPHMKGIVTWNNLEKSWDCPLHGSRFSAFGEVMNGPANADLEEVAVAADLEKETI